MSSSLHSITEHAPMYARIASYCLESPEHVYWHVCWGYLYEKYISNLVPFLKTGLQDDTTLRLTVNEYKMN